MTDIDGGVLDAVLDEIKSYENSTLADVAAYGLGEMSEGDESKFPAVMVTLPRDRRGGVTTCEKTHRRCEVTIRCRATSYAMAAEIFSHLSDIARDIAESPHKLSVRMPEGASVFEVDIEDTQTVKAKGYHSKSLTLSIQYEIVR